jgi:hypothetical protein
MASSYIQDAKIARNIYDGPAYLYLYDIRLFSSPGGAGRKVVGASVAGIGCSCRELSPDNRTLLLDRAQNEWGWVAANVIGINLGLMESTQVLSGLSADCDRVVGLLGERIAEE